MLSVVLSFLFVFLARVIDVSLGTVRTLMVMRGRRLPAAAIGFFEVTIYILALSQVIAKIHSSPAYLFVYACGFATGNYLGILIEEKMALGFLTVQVILPGVRSELVTTLRAAGYGVTALAGEGRDGPRQILFVVLKRKLLPHFLAQLNELEPKAVTTVLDTRRILGGTHPQFIR